MTITTYRLPAYWAPALINEDCSGLKPAECRAIERFLDELTEAGHGCPISCDDESEFSRSHDAWHLWPYAGATAAFHCVDYGTDCSDDTLAPEDKTPPAPPSAGQLVRFADIVLAILTQHEDWGADTLDQVAAAAESLGLCVPGAAEFQRVNGTSAHTLNDKPGPGLGYVCSRCGSSNVQVCLPGWYR